MGLESSIELCSLFGRQCRFVAFFSEGIPQSVN